MNCQLALQRLDAARPDGSDWDQPELQEARQHLDSCSNCNRTLAQRQAWDLAFQNTAANTAAAPPDRLAERILESLKTHTPTQPEIAQSVPAQWWRRPVRLRWLSMAVAALLLVGVGLDWYWNREPTGPLTIDMIRDWPDAQFQGVDDFEALAALPEWIETSGRTPLPSGWNPAWMRGPARGWSDRGSVAVMAFQVPLTRSDSVNGLLLAVPIDQMAQLPGVGSANTARPKYSKSGRFITTAWTDKASGTVFICLVARGQHKRLRRALFPRSA